MKDTDIVVLKSLLLRQPVAALSTLHNGAPAVSMVPFAMLPDGSGFIIHVSSLASHTSDMLENAAVALLIRDSYKEGASPLALPRVSIQGRAWHCAPESDRYSIARSSYLHKLPDAEPLFSFTDFSLFIIEVESLRFVAGFGKARSLTLEQLRKIFT